MRPTRATIRRKMLAMFRPGAVILVGCVLLFVAVVLFLPVLIASIVFPYWVGNRVIAIQFEITKRAQKAFIGKMMRGALG